VAFKPNFSLIQPEFEPFFSSGARNNPTILINLVRRAPPLKHDRGIDSINSVVIGDSLFCAKLSQQLGSVVF
jgi:hypothetical protein